MVGHLRVITKSKADAEAVRRFLAAVCGDVLWQAEAWEGHRGDFLGYATLEIGIEQVAAADALATRVVAAEQQAGVATDTAWHFYHCRECAEGSMCAEGTDLLAALRGVSPEIDVGKDAKR